MGMSKSSHMSRAATHGPRMGPELGGKEGLYSLDRPMLADLEHVHISRRC